MLTNLTINNVVLIDHLSLKGEKGLCALTGETGAGKSILLDALGLAIGERAESKLVRHHANKANVTANFDISINHKVFNLLKERDIEINDNQLILRRSLSADGRSKAFINDIPTSVNLLKEIGSLLIEVHGQFATRGLMNSETHLKLVDEYAGIVPEVNKLNNLYYAWKTAKEKLAQAMADIETSKMQEEYLTHAVNELEKLDPQIGEEEELASKRKALINMEKTKEAFDQTSQLLENEQGILNLFGRLQSVIDKTELPDLINTTLRAKAELDEISYLIDKYQSGGLNEGETLEQIEDRYFALKDCARKHRVSVDDLPKIFEDLSQKLKLITHQEDALLELETKVSHTKEEFIKLASKISKKRKDIAVKLSKAVNKELPALKLDKAKFTVDVETNDNENNWNANGFNKVRFLVSTNPQTPAGEISKIASGGELSRLMLAIKVVLAETGTVSTLIFDEVDSGIGGATADAVGERLARLSNKYQILVVTHSAQVAARADNHWVISKSDIKGTTITNVNILQNKIDREDEVARMISGATITKEAKAAAAKLLERECANVA